MNGKDKRLHGSFGDSVIERKEEADVEEQQAGGGEGKQEKTAKGFKPNALLYLKKIKEPGFAAELKRKGCSGWPCHAGFLCDFCMLRPEWIAESKLEPLNEEIAELKQSIIILRKQQQDVETLERAERLVAGKYWSKSDEERKMTLNSMLEDSTARVEAQEATRAKIAAEKVRDSLLDQLSRVQEKVKLQEKDNTSLKQQVMALQQTLEESRRKLNFVEKDLEDKRSMISEAFKEKSRATTEARRLKLEVEATNMEIAVKNEQIHKLIEELQKLQGVTEERDVFRALADRRAMLSQSIMDEVAEDVVKAERIRDEHVNTIRKLQKELATTRKNIAMQHKAKQRAESSGGERK